MTKLGELKKLAEAATPGPWIAEDADDLCRVFAQREINRMVSDGSRLRDAGFIASASPQIILTMCDLLEQMRDALGQYQSVCSSVYDHNDFTPKVKDEGFHARNALAAFDKWNNEQKG